MNNSKHIQRESYILSLASILITAIILITAVPDLTAQVAYQGNGVTKVGTQQNMSRSITIPPGRNRVLVVHAGTFGCNVGATFNGNAMTKVVTRSPVGWIGESTIFIRPLGNGCSFTGTVAVQSGGGGGGGRCPAGPAKIFWAGSFQHVNQAIPFQSQGGNISPGVTSTVGNLSATVGMDMLFDGIVTNPNINLTASGGGTVAYNQTYSSGAARSAARFRAAAANPESGVWNTPGGPYRGHVAVILNGVAVDNTPIPDIVPPVANCQNVTVSLDGSGNATVTPAQVDNGSFDACNLITIGLSGQTSYNCSDISPPDISVTLTVTDAVGNMDQCNASVTVIDGQGPNANCQDVTVFLDAGNNASVVPDDVDDGSTDNCGSVDNRTVSPNSFDCSDLGGNTVTLTLTDNGNNSANCTATVTVKDTVPPTAICQNITISVEPDGTKSIAHDEVNNGSSDNCGGVTFSTSQVDFNCDDLGTNTVTLTVMDTDSSATCTATVTVEDNAPVSAICKDITVDLNASGNASISPASVDDGSGSGCDEVSFQVSPSSLSCPDVGDVGVTLTVTDNENNSATCNATVTVRDITPPQALCEDITVHINNSLIVTIAQDSVDNGSSDACGIASYSTSLTEFSCELEDSPFQVTMTVTDVNGNTDDCQSTVTVKDTLPPEAVCRDITVFLDNTGNVMISQDSIDNGSSDTCDLESIMTSQTEFDCTDAQSSPVTVTLTVVDKNDQVSTCTADVTVRDTTPPVALCQNVDVFLDNTGNASISQDSMDNGSSDVCGIDTYETSQTSFDCDDALLSPINATLTVTDNNGNSSTCTATITVSDTVKPIVICKDITVYLDANGSATISQDSLDDGSSDACGIETFQTSQTTFDCDDALLSPLSLTMTVTDFNTNSNTCTQSAEVLDTIFPVALCKDITLYLDQNLQVVATPDDVDDGSYDNCGIDTMYLSRDSFDCSDFGDHVVTLTISDPIGNQSSCNAAVTIENDPNQALCCLDGVTDNHFIQRVQEYLNNVTNDSGDDNGFGDYTSIDFSITNPYMPYLYFVFTPGNVQLPDLQNWELYIDWNKNELFEPSEKVMDYCTSIPFSRFLNMAGFPPGEYRMRLVMQSDTDNDGCQPGELPADLCGPIGDGEVEDYTLEIDLLTQMQPQLQAQNQLQIFPNPVSDEFYLTLSGPFEIEVEVDIEVVSVSGRRIMQHNRYFTGEPVRIDASELPAGTYFVRVNTGEEVLVTTLVKR